MFRLCESSIKFEYFAEGMLAGKHVKIYVAKSFLSLFVIFKLFLLRNFPRHDRNNLKFQTEIYFNAILTISKFQLHDFKDVAFLQ